jgi:hypothetical protein
MQILSQFVNINKTRDFHKTVKCKWQVPLNTTVIYHGFRIGTAIERWRYGSGCSPPVVEIANLGIICTVS